MSIIAEVKCARCDRKYSGVRSRCPYCGARRIGRGKYSEGADNSKGKMLIGILILAVLCVAVVVLLATTEKTINFPDDEQTAQIEETPLIPGETDNEVIPGPIIETAGPSEPVDETPSPVAPTVESVTIRYQNSPRKEFTAKISEQVPLNIKIEPAGVEAEIEWLSSNTTVFDVVETDTTHIKAKVTGKAKGSGTLTVRVGDVEATCIVRVS